MLKHRIIKDRLECGTDEAGRGCLAGPVTAAAVIMPKGFNNEWITDSKKLSESKRNLLRPIIEKEAICYGVAHVFPKEIDEINILNASILAMHRAIEKMIKTPEYILVDGNKFKPYKKIPHECVIKGDSKYLNIAAASILAKTYRDEYMLNIHDEFPNYGWNQNKGYPTKKHKKALVNHGDCKYHRQSFQLFNTQLQLEL